MTEHIMVSLPAEDVAFIRGFDPDRDRTASRADMVRVIQHLQAALLDARIDELHGPGAAAALNAAIADGSIFGEREDVEVDVEHIMTADGCKISVNGQGHLPCTEHIVIEDEEAQEVVHKLNARTGFGRRAECAITAPLLSAARDWDGVTCPRCLAVKPA